MSRLILLPLIAALTSAGLFACVASDEPELAHTLAPVIYGEDGRQDWYTLEDPPLQTQLRDSVAAMIPWRLIDLSAPEHVLLRSPNLGTYANLCADQRFIEQPTAANCSGTLIAPDLILTAGHCVENQRDCAGSAWVFDYLYEDDGQLASIPRTSVYHCVSVLVTSGLLIPRNVDLAIIQLDRAATDRTPAPLAPPVGVTLNQPLILPGFPSGLPLKIDQGGRVMQSRNATQHSFTTSVDAFGGNSGSGVLNEENAILGVLVSGLEDYRNAGSCRVAARYPDRQGQESVIFAHIATDALCDSGYPDPTLCPEAPEPLCGDGYCDLSERDGLCPEDCRGLFAVPDTWHCNPAWYDANDGCDCDCGAPDPDCENPSATLYHCAPGATCDAEGHCSDPLPEGWTCASSAYGDGRRCDCDCGAPDPDCENDRLSINGCAIGSACQPDGTCVVSIPDSWFCADRYYAAGDGCDCNCGAYDPDCDDPNQRIFGCRSGSACIGDGHCEIGPPPSWVCGDEHYDSGGPCDCNCGAYDPDCDTARQTRNCPSGQVCAPDGSCVPPDQLPDNEVSDTTSADPDPADITEPEPDTQGPDTDAPDIPDAGDADSLGPEISEPDTSKVAEPPPSSDLRVSGGCQGGAYPGLWALALLFLRRRRATR